MISGLYEVCHDGVSRYVPYAPFRHSMPGHHPLTHFRVPDQDLLGCDSEFSMAGDHGFCLFV